MKKTYHKLALSLTICSISFTAFAEKNGIYVGGNFGGIIHAQDISTGFTAEGVIGYQATQYSAYQITGMYGAEQNSWLMAEGLLKLPIGRFITPYLLVGAGYTHLPNNNAGIEFGGGINLNITQDVSISGQYKFVQAFGSGTPYANVLSGGITYYFGN
jgi:opacity protein-like surface antigen